MKKLIIITSLAMQGCFPNFTPNRVRTNVISSSRLVIDKVEILGILDQSYRSTIIIYSNDKIDSLCLFKTYECRFQNDTLFLDGYDTGGDTLINGIIVKYN
ncbi:MAG: hypothetical protein K6G31_03070 [Paludibacteraceae bacterium]|nr:hypothetical protein [Paludibacteraceae bacterium]